jgi:hypothetical protein
LIDLQSDVGEDEDAESEDDDGNLGKSHTLLRIVLQPLLPDAFVVSDTEEDAEEDDSQNRFDPSVSDGDLERLAEHIRKTYGRTRDYDDAILRPLQQENKLWMLRTTVRTVVIHRFRR